MRNFSYSEYTHYTTETPVCKQFAIRIIRIGAIGFFDLLSVPPLSSGEGERKEIFLPFLGVRPARHKIARGG